MSNVGWLAPSSSGHSGGDRQSHQEESSCPGSRNGGRFVDIAEAYELRLLQLNVVSTVHLSKRLLPAMVERGVGRMLFTAAVASTMPGPQGTHDHVNEHHVEQQLFVRPPGPNAAAGQRVGVRHGQQAPQRSPRVVHLSDDRTRSISSYMTMSRSSASGRPDWSVRSAMGCITS